MSDEQLEELGLIADQVDNLMAGLLIPMPDRFHKEQMLKLLPVLSYRLKKLYQDCGGPNHWDVSDS